MFVTRRAFDSALRDMARIEADLRHVHTILARRRPPRASAPIASPAHQAQQAWSFNDGQGSGTSLRTRLLVLVASTLAAATLGVRPWQHAADPVQPPVVLAPSPVHPFPSARAATPENRGRVDLLKVAPDLEKIPPTPFVSTARTSGSANLPAPTVPADGDDQGTLLRLHEGYFEAFRLGDKRGIQRLAADGFTSEGEPPGAAGAPLEIWAGGVSITWQAEGATVEGMATLRVRTPDGRHVGDVNYRLSEAWTKRNSEWRLASVHFVNAAEEDSAEGAHDLGPPTTNEDETAPDPVDIGPGS